MNNNSSDPMETVGDSARAKAREMEGFLGVVRDGDPTPTPSSSEKASPLPDGRGQVRASSNEAASKDIRESVSGMFFDDGTQIETEISRVLLVRLRRFTVIFLAGWIFFYLAQVASQPVTPHFFTFALIPALFSIVVVCGFLGLLKSAEAFPLRRLRQVEITIFVFVSLLLCWEEFRFLTLEGFLASYAERGTMDMIILARCPVHMHFSIIVAYGTFIPNTGRRCFLVAGALVGMALCAGLLSCLVVETVGLVKGIQFIGESALWLFVGWAFAVYGSSKSLSVKIRRLSSSFSHT